MKLINLLHYMRYWNFLRMHKIHKIHNIRIVFILHEAYFNIDVYQALKKYIHVKLVNFVNYVYIEKVVHLLMVL